MSVTPNASFPKEDLVRLRHMLDASVKARRFTAGRAKIDLAMDEMFALAMVRLLEIIGEAATHVSDPTRAALPEIPWREITGARNRLVHGYFEVDLEIVWQIVEQDLPRLIEQLEQALPKRR